MDELDYLHCQSKKDFVLIVLELNKVLSGSFLI